MEVITIKVLIDKRIYKEAKERAKKRGIRIARYVGEALEHKVNEEKIK